MKESKFNVGDILQIVDGCDRIFVAIVQEVRINRYGIRYLIKNSFGHNELSEGFCVFSPDEYNNCEGESYYTIVDKVGHINYEKND